MRVLVAVALVLTAMAGCIQNDEPVEQEPVEWDHEPDPLPDVNDTANDTVEDAVVETSWWMSCDWQDVAPSPAREAWTDRVTLHIAHQGAENEVPSATMYALKTSIRKGADMLEIDVHVTSDGEIVVLHDTTVDRTTDGSGAVEEMTLAEIKALDAAYWFVPEQHRAVTTDAAEEEYVFRGIRTGDRVPPPGCTPEDFTIPTLKEVLEEFPDVMMNIEIKNGPPLGTEYSIRLADMLLEHGRGDDVIVAAFQDQWTEALHLYSQDAIDTSTGTGQTAIAKAISMEVAPGGPTGFHEAYQVPVEFEGIEVVDQGCDFVADAHANGMAVHVWTINDPDTMRWLIDCGVDGIMTAESTVLEAVIQEKGVAWS